MSKKMPTPPKYPHRPTTLGVPLDCDHSDPSSATLPVLMYAVPLRRRAGAVLNTPFSDNRLTLVLALMVTIGLGLAAPMILDSLLMLADVLLLLSPTAQTAWVLILHGCLIGGVSVFFSLPLLCSLCRMAVLMTEAHRRTEAGLPTEKISLGECLYPFTSFKAYGRTLYVALRGVGHLMLAMLPSVAIMIAAFWWMPLVKSALSPLVYVLMWVGNVAAACLLLVLLTVALSRGAGFAYYVFACPELPLKEVRIAFKKRRPMGWLPVWTMFGYTGWVLLSLLAVFIPFLLHTLPHMLLASASYGRFLMDTSIPAEAAAPEAIPETDFRGGEMLYE